MLFTKGKFATELKQVFFRFPISVLCSALLTLLLFDEANGRITDKINAYSVFIPAFFAAGAITLWAENRGGFVHTWRHFLALIAAIIFGAMGGAAFWLDINYITFYLALTLSLLVAPFVFKQASEGTIWLFCLGLCLSIILAIVTGLVFGAGLWAILESLEALFGLRASNSLIEEIWLFSFFFVGPVIGLTLAPKDSGAELTLPESGTALARGKHILLNFILAPLILIYAIILHAYAAKIISEWSLPKGQIGFMVLSFTSALVIFVLIAQPWVERCNRLTQALIKHWYILLFVPLGLLSISIFRRISDYGFTPERYMLVVFGLWMVWLLVGSIIKRGALGKVSIIGSITALLLFTAFGPWGSIGYSVQDQSKRFIALLDKNNVLDNGKVKHDLSSVAISASDQSQLKSLINFLRKQKKLHHLKDMFAGHPKNPFNDGKKSYAVAKSMRTLLSIKTNIIRYNNGQIIETVRFGSNKPSITAIDGAVNIIGYHRLFNGKDYTLNGDNKFSLHETTLSLTIDSNTWSVDLKPMLDEIEKVQRTVEVQDREPFIYRHKTRERTTTLIVTGVQADKRDDTWHKLRSMSVTIILSKP